MNQKLHDILNLLGDFVSIRTVNDPNSGERPSRENVLKIKDIIDSTIKFQSELIERNGYYTIYGEVGSGEPILLLLAHFDTVPVIMEEWKTDPFKLTIVGDKAFGRGVFDDKSNLAILTYCIKNLIKERFKGTLIFAFTGDEEVGGVNGALYVRNMLKRRNMMPHYVVNGDGQGLKVIIRRRNAFRVSIVVPEKKEICTGTLERGRINLEVSSRDTRHAAYFIPGIDKHPLLTLSEYIRWNDNLVLSKLDGGWVKSNVLPGWISFEAVNIDAKGEQYAADLNLTSIIKALLPISRINIKTEFFSEYGITITPNVYRYMSGKHLFELDIRIMTMNSDQIKASIGQILKDLELTSYQVRVFGGSGFLYTDKGSNIVKLALKALENSSLKPVTIEACGASDSRFFSPEGIQCIDFGPQGGNVHGPNEYVHISSLKKAYNFYMHLLKSILK